MNGILVVFAPEAKVYAEMPSTVKTYHKQRSRWDMGKYKLRNKYVPLLFFKGLKEKRLAYWDAILELIIPPFMLYTASSVFLSVVYFLLFFKHPDFHFYLWIVLIAGILSYTIVGLTAARATFKVYINLIYTPFLLISRLATIIESLHNEGKTWIKTERI